MGIKNLILVVYKLEFYSKMQSINEPTQDKTNKMACASSKDSDQTGRTDFAVRMKKAVVLGYHLSAQRRL